MKIFAIILAAGLSSRMGELKPLLDVCGETALARCCRVFSRAENVFVVTGHRREELAPVIAASGARELFNPDYLEGMFTSIRAGVARAAECGADGALISPADCPLVPPEAVDKVLEAAKKAPDRLAVACFAGKKGHPLYIPRRLFSEILEHDGENGLRGVTARHEEELIRVETRSEGVLMDMDTPEAYRRLLDYATGRTPPLVSLISGRRFILTRHGATLPFGEKTFIGRVDVPLSEKGREDAEKAAREILRLHPAAARVYTSPLSRARATAEVVASALRLPVCEDARLAELSLGEWDGLAISEVRRRFPEQYAARGRNLPGFRVPGGETFYELRQRTADFLRAALTEDSSPELVIVSHKGVIHCVEALVTGVEPELTSRRPEKGETLVLPLKLCCPSEETGGF